MRVTSCRLVWSEEQRAVRILRILDAAKENSWPQTASAMRFGRVASSALFSSFFLGGFECSSHRLKSGRRLDLLASTKHDRFATQDYARLRDVGITAARDGIRWHLIEGSPGRYDFAATRAALRAARDAGIQVIWDTFHYGWPDDINIFRPAFVERLANFVRAFIQVHGEEVGGVPWIAPVNEISFFAWAGAQVAIMNPGKTRRGDELKAQLVRACIGAMQAARETDPRTRFVHTDPIIHVVGEPGNKRAQSRAEAYRAAQFQSWDMISGRTKPELGGRPEYLDVLGLNYYPRNQWMVRKTAPGQRHPPFIFRGDPHYRPLRDILREIHDRYQRPMFLAETGTEGEERPEWLRYVCDEVSAAQTLGVPIGGICLYPVLNHPGWTNNRHCHNALWDYADRNGAREIYAPLAEELARQRKRFA